MSDDYSEGENVFEGTATNHDFHSALHEAIEAAKTGLQSTLIHWKLLEISGEDGGFAQVTTLSVKIRAAVGPNPQA